MIRKLRNITFCYPRKRTLTRIVIRWITEPCAIRETFIISKRRTIRIGVVFDTYNIDQCANVTWWVEYLIFGRL